MPMASAETLKRYRDEAVKKIERAQRKFPGLRPLEALFRYVVTYPEKLSSGTVGLWRQTLRIAIANLAEVDPRGFNERQIANFVQSMDEAVNALKGRPSAPRTATKKRKDPPKEEVVKVFGHLKARALKLSRVRMAATAMYCLLMPRLGARPVELVGAKVLGGHLVLPNAKRAIGQDAERALKVSEWHLQHRVALAVLLDIVEAEVSDGGYDAWLSILAETLARACEVVEVRRLAPSSFRHTALSTWSAAGYSVEEIARLAGHFSTRSPAHYIRTASAWGPEDAIVPSTSGPIESLASAETSDRSSGLYFDLSPMPQPPPKIAEQDTSKTLWDDHRRRLEEEARALDAALASRSELAPGTKVAADRPREPDKSRLLKR